MHGAEEWLAVMLREFHLSRAPANATRSAVQQKLEAERAAEMSFRPHMVSHSHHHSHAPPASRAEHLEQLSRPRTALWARCACLRPDSHGLSELMNRLYIYDSLGAHGL